MELNRVMADFSVTFPSLGKTVTVDSQTTLLEAAGRAGTSINSVCGGDGICGRCKMIVRSGKVRSDTSMLLTRDEVQAGTVLACQAYPESDLVVDIPDETRVREKLVIDEEAQRFRSVHPSIRPREFVKQPLVEKVFLKLDKPTLDDNQADWQRLERELERRAGIASTQAGLRIMRRLPGLLRESGYEITVTVGRRGRTSEIMDIESGNTARENYLVAVDIGTSTIVVHLLDATTLSTCDAEACFNSQSLYGREVTARLIACERKGFEHLQQLLVEDINRLISALSARNRVSLKSISGVITAGNTAMMHFLLGLPVENIRRTPFIAATVQPPPLRAAEVGIKINPRGLLVVVPGISAWVGGDLTAGILATGLNEMDGIGMLIDIGTNGEIILGNKDWLIACSASVGPALEGASVECGMMAERGAIEHVSSRRGRIRYKTIGGGEPVGMCGSGIIDMIAVLLDLRVVSRAGKFIMGSHPSLVFEHGLGRFIVARGEETANGRPVYMTQDDIDNVISAKAAVFAAAKTLLDRLQLGFGNLDSLFIAGGFGSYIDLANAVTIGLLPEMPLSRVRFVGNTSIWGAKLAAFSLAAFDSLGEIRRKTTYYDLMGSNDYVDQFRQAMFLPHTNIELFPQAFVKANEADEKEKARVWQEQS